MEAVIHKPGCFASASIYSSDSKVCQACPAAALCADAALETLKRIRATVNVDALIAKHRVARPASPLVQPKPQAQTPAQTQQMLLDRVLLTLGAEDQAAIKRMSNAKAQQIAVTLLANGELAQAKRRLAQGQHPMTTGRPKWLAEHFAALIEANGQVERSTLRQAMGQRMQWNKQTADPHTSMFVAIGVGLRLVDFDGATITIRKED